MDSAHQKLFVCNFPDCHCGCKRFKYGVYLCT